MAQFGKESGITWYDVLGLLPGASAEQVKSRYDAKAGLLRPEHMAGAPSPVVAAASRARDILDSAQRVLADPANRARYDEAVGIRRSGGGLAPHRGSPSEPGWDMPDAYVIGGREGAALLGGLLALTGLLGGPAMTAQARGTRPGQPFDGHQPAAGLQYAPCLPQARIDVGPVVHAGDRPGDRHRRVRQWQGLCAPLGIAHRPAGPTGEQPGDLEHRRLGVDPDHRGAEPGSVAYGGTRPASDVGHRVVRGECAEARRQAGFVLSAEHHGGGGEVSGETSETRKAGVMIRDCGMAGRHASDLDS